MVKSYEIDFPARERAVLGTLAPPITKRAVFTPALARNSNGAVFSMGEFGSDQAACSKNKAILLYR
jgi:hypothetical protein